MWPFRFLRKSPATSEETNRVLLLWWGSFARGGGTIGDYWSVRNLADRLVRSGVECDIMAGVRHDFGVHNVVGYHQASPSKYRAVAFVCGPLIFRRRIRRLLRPYRRLPSCALAVSVIGPKAKAHNWFDEIIERDSDETIRFDLAIARAPESTDPPTKKTKLSICLRGKQKDYGKDADLSGEVDAVVNRVAQELAGESQHIDTVLRATNAFQRIETQFKCSRLLITTRLHGSLFALYYRVPFIAIDHIRGGAKVSRLLATIGWPSMFSAENMTEQTLRDESLRLLASGWTEEMERVRITALARSSEMADICADCLIRLGGFSKHAAAIEATPVPSTQ